jgi:hypothetical protein
VIHRCLAKEQEERFADMADLEAELCLAQIDAGVATPWDDLPLPQVDDDRRQRILTGLQKAARGKPVDSGAPMVVEAAASRPISVDDLRTVARPMPKAPAVAKPPIGTPAIAKPAIAKTATAKPAIAKPPIVHAEPPGLPQAFPMTSDSGPIGAGDDEPTDRNEPLSKEEQKTLVSRAPAAPPVPGVAPRKLPTPPVLSTSSKTITPAPRPGPKPPVVTPKLAAPIVSTPAKTIVAAPKVEAPKVETPKVEAPKVEAPKVETPAPAPTPIVELPKPAPVIAAPEPVVEQPIVEAPEPVVAAPEPAPVVEAAPIAPQEPAPPKPTTTLVVTPIAELPHDEPPKPTTTVVVAPVADAFPPPPASPIEETSARTVAPDPWAATADTYYDDVAPPKRPWVLYAVIMAASLIVGIVATRAIGGDDEPDPPKTTAEATKTPEPTPKPAQPDPEPAKAPDPIEPDVAPEEPTPTPTPTPTTNKRGSKKTPRTSTPRVSTPSPAGGEPSGSSAALYAEGNRAFNSGNYSRAESLLSKAVKQSPGSSKYRLSLGDALFKHGKYQLARIHYVKARELGHPSAARRVEAVDAKLGG